MITPPTEIFYVINLQGNAAEIVASSISSSALSDIREAVLISEEYSNDIEAETRMDMDIENIRQHLVGDLQQFTSLNPLYIPSTEEAIDDVLVGDTKTDNFRFTGMDGSPFTMKTVSITADDVGILQGKITCKPFDLPSYEDIVEAQKNLRFN